MQPPLPAAVVRDTLERVFADAAFARGIRETLLTRLTRWLGDLFTRLLEAGASNPLVRWAAIAFLALIVLAVIGRVVWSYVLERRALANLAAAAGGDGRRGEAPYEAAQRAAAAGEHTAAAHHLYHAIVLAVARRERLRLHPAKTSGDYTRDLRLRQSAAYEPFRVFARSYERAVYGGDRVDGAGWDRLHTLALPLLDLPAGATRRAA